MKNQLLTTAALFFIAVTACDKGKEEEQPVEIPITHYENRVELRIEDSVGTDLLNQQNIGHYKDSDIDILESYDAINAVSVIKYSPETNYYCLVLNLNYSKVDIDRGKKYDDELISKVKFGDNEADEVKGLYEIKYHDGSGGLGTSSGYTVILRKAWIGSKLIYDKQEAESPGWELPIIVKEHNN